MPRYAATRLVAFALIATSWACGGGSPTSPSSSGSSGLTLGALTETTTITITGAGVTPNNIRIAVGQSVTVVNNDSRAHEISSDPHPTHTDCPPMSQLGNIPAGATRQTAAFTTARTCGFHDHNQPSDDSLKGRILIQ